jgi:hypothetical protein
VTLERVEARPAVQVAEKYGIRVRWVKSPSDVPHLLRGPQGHGCSPERRVVYFVGGDKYHYSPEGYFHELVHVIVQCPWKCWEIESIPEDFLLLQFERALARQTYDKRTLRRVVEWQEETCVHMHHSDELGMYSEYRRSKLWKYGFKVARVLGLLDEQNKPTYAWPNWKKLEPYRKDLSAYFLGYGINPYPRLE